MANDVVTYVAADGTELRFANDSDADTLRGSEGRGMPPVSFVEEAVPLQPGSRLREVKVQPRTVTVLMSVQKPTATELRTRLRQMAGILDPTRGDGKLRVVAPDGSQRELTCRYAGGFELSDARDVFGERWQKAALVFRAFEPYWTDTADNVSTHVLGAPATFFPFFPLRLTSTTIFADATITNDGDAEAWPIIVVTGPGTSPIARNLTTNKKVDLTGLTLSAGETATIDTRPGKKSVKRNDGVSLYASLTADSELWSLVRSANAIRVEMANATADSSVRVTYRRLYLSC